MKMNMGSRMKNLWFWIAIGAAVLSALNLDPATFTSWDLVFQCVKDVVLNPFKLGLTILTILGIFVDPSTPGISDLKSK